jgi:hypothetical protein
MHNRVGLSDTLVSFINYYVSLEYERELQGRWILNNMMHVCTYICTRIYIYIYISCIYCELWEFLSVWAICWICGWIWLYRRCNYSIACQLFHLRGTPQRWRDHVIGTGYKPQGKWDVISIGCITIHSDMSIWKSTKAKISRAVNDLKLCKIRPPTETREGHNM